ncbi:MAG: TerB family tellurite resistance protein [Roseinatronobacter sp.]|nr:MAG: TerB family tellurite resistance protein [Roseinatronobacter sp.]
MRGMSNKTLRWIQGLFAPTQAPDTRADVTGESAVAALLVRAARANDDYNPLQVAAIDAVLSRRFGLGPWDCAALRAKAEKLEAATGDSVHLTRAIKDVLPLEERPAYLRDLWEVILADGQRHEQEDGLMRLVSNLLGLRDRDSAHARQYVQARMTEADDQRPLAR